MFDIGFLEKISPSTIMNDLPFGTILTHIELSFHKWHQIPEKNWIPLQHGIVSHDPNHRFFTNPMYHILPGGTVNCLSIPLAEFYCSHELGWQFLVSFSQYNLNTALGLETQEHRVLIHFKICFHTRISSTTRKEISEKLSSGPNCQFSRSLFNVIDIVTLDTTCCRVLPYKLIVMQRKGAK